MHTLLKGLEKIALSADIPMLVAGDFNSMPGSAAHALLVHRSVPSSHPVPPSPALLYSANSPGLRLNLSLLVRGGQSVFLSIPGR